MADSTVSALTAASALAGAELLYGVQAGFDRKITAIQLRQFSNGGVYNVQDYGWLPDNTNHATEALALLATVAAANGGTVYFPPSAGTYRCDSQLFIPNDSATIPKQTNIRLTGAGGGLLWGDVTRTQRGAATLDLRYTAVDGNAKIESRGSGSLAVDNLTFIDGGASNATPFIHITNTTLTLRGNTFIGSGSTTQDAVVLGGPSGSATTGGAVGSIFQGYGTLIDSNMFRRLNRGVFGRCFTNSVIVTNNSWLASTGTVAIEFSADTGNPPDIITGVYVAGNIIEMSDPMLYGVVLSGVGASYFCNSFYDKQTTYVSDYRLQTTVSVPHGGTLRNTFLKLLSGGTGFSQSGDATQLALQTYIGADGGSNPFANGIASSFFARGVEVDGSWTPANAAAGALNVRDEFNTNELLCLAATNSGTQYIDGYNAVGFWRGLTVNPRGGWLGVTGPLLLRPTALTLANGLNSNKGLWASDSTNKSSYIRITGPTGAFSLGGLATASSGSASFAGNMLTIYNSTAQQMTIVNEDASSTAANRIRTLTGANVTLRAGTSSVTMIYDDTDLRWILTGQN